VWLRELVLIFFYPLAGVEFFLLLALTWTGCKCAGTSRRYLMTGVAGLILSWGLFLMVMIILVTNNLINFWENRPLHWHGQ